jgi:glutamate--glyoxylate aminotransferase
MQSNHSKSKVLTLSTINTNFKNAKYEVRGEIYLAGVKRQQEGKEVIQLNVGNPQALGQQPLTFNRQVMSLLMAPFLMGDANILRSFPSDVIERAKLYLSKLKGGLGAYSDSKGNPYIRQEIADFITRQAGSQVPSSPDHIFCSNGASECARMILQALIRGETDGIMVPIPQYPLYSASIALYGGQLVGYYLNEEGGWALDMNELRTSLNNARLKGITCRALVFINPGNPTGQCLTEQSVKDLITFCYENSLILIADEVYQENIYNSAHPFFSARKLLGQMTEPIRSGLELVSFHTVSKGAYGECGLRGGYMELHNFEQEILDEMYKIASINLCPNVPGQVALGLMVNPPRQGDPSYELYIREKNDLIESLKRRAKLITDAFNSLEGVTCQVTEGAMYSFPQVSLPQGAIDAAQKKGKSPDVMYCLELLEETGLSCVPGSGFQQKPGTFHIRTTILVSFDFLFCLFVVELYFFIPSFPCFHYSFLVATRRSIPRYYKSFYNIS